MAINALGNVGPRMGRFGMPGRRRLRGFGDLVQEQVVSPRRLVPGGRNFLGDLVEFQQLPSRGQAPRFTPPNRFAGGRLGGPRRGLRLRGLESHDGAGWDPEVDFPTHPRPTRKRKSGPKRCAGRAVRCKMVKAKGGKKRRMCWDAKGMIAKIPKRKKRK